MTRARKNALYLRLRMTFPEVFIPIFSAFGQVLPGQFVFVDLTQATIDSL